MTLRFNPPLTVLRYALYIKYQGGSEIFKPYRNLGSVKNSYHWSGHHDVEDARILENIDGEWYTLYKIDPKADHLPWEKEVDVYRYDRWSNNKEWRPVPMTREEYGNWRAEVERERLNVKSHPSYAEALTR